MIFRSSSRQLGRPGIPGSNDLETALRRLALRKANKFNESQLEELDQRYDINTSTFRKPKLFISTALI